jgi:signal transduction histidine kinase
VARPRWLRHKLTLGLALVVGSVGLLLGGTLYGIYSYLTTVRTTERKLYELQQVNVILHTLTGGEQVAPRSLDAEFHELKNRIENVKGFVVVYRNELGLTVSRGLNPDDGNQEGRLLDGLDADLDRLAVALQASRSSTKPFGDSGSLRDDPAIRSAYNDSRSKAEALRQAIFDAVQTSIRSSNKAITKSLWIAGGATFQLIVIVLALLYYFRQWIYNPIRQLQAGVQRVHAGEFNQPIRLQSRDELEELATELNAMTARVLATMTDLARQVNERSRQLVRSERMVSVGFLAAGVAHEINNPLASILFCAEALERRLDEVLAAVAARHGPPADTEVLTRYLKMIQQEALRCKDITQKLLDFSRTGERKRESTDLAGLVKGVLEVARHLPNCRSKNISFDPDAYIVAPVNGQDLKSVILNLVVNALDSMEENGTLTIRLSANETYAEVAFTDTGCGMAPDVLQNIFEPFFTRSRTGKGTGLGLFISHQIIDQHGGTIEAASPGPGHGSTFTVRVPLREVDRGQLPVGGAADAGEVILPFPGKMAA